MRSSDKYLNNRTNRVSFMIFFAIVYVFAWKQWFIELKHWEWVWRGSFINRSFELLWDSALLLVGTVFSITGLAVISYLVSEISLKSFDGKYAGLIKWTAIGLSVYLIYVQLTYNNTIYDEEGSWYNTGAIIPDGDALGLSLFILAAILGVIQANKYFDFLKEHPDANM